MASPFKFSAPDICTEILKKEGGYWEPIVTNVPLFGTDMDFIQPEYHAYRFKSGRIWDVVNGWRDQVKQLSASGVVATVATVPVKEASAARTFSTGATRDTDNGKLDYEAFLSPLVLERYAQYMHKNRVQSDGRLRDGDNWQKGIPQEVYIKSAWRHFMDWWQLHRQLKSASPVEMEEALCALLFNIQGYLFEQLNKRGECESGPIPEALGARKRD